MGYAIPAIAGKERLDKGQLGMRFEPCHGQNQHSGFSTWSNTNQAVQPLKIARGLKFCIQEVVIMLSK